MLKQNYNVIGVMSGTSLDGVDLAHIQFKIIDEKWTFEIFENETIGYSQNWIQTLKLAVDYENEALAELNRTYTQLLATIVLDFIAKYNISNLDAICSHGHTILHQPQNGVTLQIGNLPEISSLLDQTVVCDFRKQDVELGGQGAPLVPIGDRILFPQYDYCMNLGGFSNVSFEDNGNRIAFDISPVNTVLNYYANQLGLDYDDKGQIARSGNCNENLLAQLNAVEFYKKKHPKSLGFEFVKNVILPILESFSIPLEDKLKTFTDHVATQIAEALPTKKGTLFVTGGGVYNAFLLTRITAFLPEMEIIIPSRKIIEFKEALIFALLGVLKLRTEINVLKSVTGAQKDHSSGLIFK